eukprot:s44_g37.t1
MDCLSFHCTSRKIDQRIALSAAARRYEEPASAARGKTDTPSRGTRTCNVKIRATTRCPKGQLGGRMVELLILTCTPGVWTNTNLEKKLTEVH